jgi:dihydroorotase
MHLLREALKYINSHNKIIISHSEDLSLANGGVINEGKISTKLGLKGIPDVTEALAVARELEIVRSVNGKYHFAHISTKRSIELIRQAKKDGLNVTAETAPHYFSLTENDIKNYEAKYKVNPPLRTQEDLEAVILGLQDGTLDVIATDHAPHTVFEKQLPIQNAPMGLAGFETALGITLTYLVHTGKLTLLEALKKLTYNPAKILDIPNQGEVEVGKAANLVVIDVNEEWIVNSSKFKSKCRISPFDGYKLKGKVKMTIINGKIINIG